MSWPASPAWLLELQARFGSMLRTPLERGSGALRANTDAYDAALVGAVTPTPTLPSAERLAVYHRQYWFRLLTVLQGLYPLTSRLLGYWRFNDFAAAHLVERPPGGYDIDTVGHDFVRTLTERLPQAGRLELDAGRSLEVAALLEAAQVDATFHDVGRAPLTAPFHPGPADASRLGSSRFVLSPAVALLRENWPLCQTRLSFLDEPREARIVLGARLTEPRHWLLARHETQLGLVALEAAEARLFSLLQSHPLERALAQLEAELPEAARAELPLRAQTWLGRSVQLGVWSGIVEADA